jgi:hypothetical protein
VKSHREIYRQQQVLRHSVSLDDWLQFSIIIFYILFFKEKLLSHLSSSPQPVPNAFQKSPTQDVTESCPSVSRGCMKNSPDNRYGKSPLFLSLRKPSGNSSRKASMMERSISPVYQVYISDISYKVKFDLTILLF